MFTDTMRAAQARLSDPVVRRPKVVLFAALLLAVVGGFVAGPAFERLAAGGFDDPGSESVQTSQHVASRLGIQAPDLLVLYSSDDFTVDDARFRTAVGAAENELRARPEVVDVEGFFDRGDQRYVSADRRQTYVAIHLKASDDTERREAFERIRDRLSADGVRTDIGGDVAIQSDGDEITAADVERAELYAFPLVLVLLFLIFRGLVAAVLPLLVGALAILGALTAVRLLETVTSVSSFAINTISLLGLGMAIDYSLIIITRYRDELGHHDVPANAVLATLRTAGRTVVVSGSTVALSLASLLVFPMPFLKSMAYGGMAAVGVAMLCSVTVLPAALTLIGRRIDALGPRRRPRRSPEDLAERGRWARFARAVMRRPAVAVLAVVVVLLALSSSVTHLRFGGFDERVLPGDAYSRIGTDRLRAAFPSLNAAPIEVLLTGQDTDRVQREVQAIDGVTGVAPATAGDGEVLLAVSYRDAAGSPQTRQLVDDIRALDGRNGVDVKVTGPPAALRDQLAGLATGLPAMLGVMVLVTLVLLFLAFGSVVLPLKAVVVNALSVAATLGVLVWGFQDAHLAGFLGFTPTGDLEPTTLVLVVALLFGLATDYEVFLLSRVREEWDRGHDSATAVVRGLQRSGGLITAAALLLGVVTAGFATGAIVISKIVGVGMVVGLAIDAVLVRVILVPATLRLFAGASWWLPRFLRPLHQRFAIRDEPTENESEICHV
ncbi:efflux RND transporter permease subunit [Kribbella sp. NPDC003505]|uniref:MMPL family transporter n=1 Tax=Kribbella sp. NPDC003505 TaxID=3154448 RepID=UPI0033BAD87C